MNLRRLLYTVGTLALTGGLLYWFLAKADLRQVAREASKASLGFLALAVVAELASVLLRAYRWRVMLRTVREGIPFAPLLRATVVGFAITGVVPGRVGEVARPYFLARWMGLPFTPLLASVVLERGMDLVALVLLWAGFLLFGRADVAEAGASLLPLFDGLTYGVLAAFAAGGAFLWWLIPHRDAFERRVESHPRLLKRKWLHKAVHLLLAFAQGLGTFRRKRDIASVLGLSLATWGVLALACWAILEALHIDLPWSAGVLLIVFVALGASIPTPGGVGGVHKLIQYALVTFYAVGGDRAVAAGILGHAAMFFPAILWGFLYLAAGKVHLGEIREEMREARSVHLVPDE